MKRSGESILKKLFKTAASANAFHLFGPKSWSPQTDYMPVQSGKEESSKADMHHKTVTAREKEV